MQRTAFVTGGTGFLGLNLVEQLSAAGWRVVAAHRPSSKLDALSRFSPELAVADILDRPALEAAMPEGVDAVFHVAGDISMWSARAAEQYRINVQGTECVLAAARTRGARRFVFTSSWASYGLGDRALSESSERRGGSSPRPYARSKYDAEQAVYRACDEGLEAVILNPALIVGRYDRSGWGRTLRLIDRGRVPGAPPGAGSFCHAAEVARTHIAAAERGGVGEHYLLGGPNATFAEVFQLIGRLLDRPVPDRVLPAWLIQIAARASALRAHFTGVEPALTPAGAFVICSRPSVVSDKAERELGYRPASLEAMFTDARDWMRREGLIG